MSTFSVIIITWASTQGPTREGFFILDTDASNVGMVAVLSQVQDGLEKVVCYFSQTFSRSDRNYYVTRRELLAVVTRASALL
jgi:hypothetical protein